MVHTSEIRRVRVLVVDDSAFARWVISGKLRSDPRVQVVGFAGDGIEALQKTIALRPDVLTLDVQMPRMDGLTALGRIMSECPTPVVMVSSVTAEDAAPTIEALGLGAVDFFLKPSTASPVGSSGESADLVAKVLQAANARVSTSTPAVALQRHRSPRRRSGSLHSVIVIGSSTGGPKALCRLTPLLPAGIPAAILIVQHMPAGFTRSLAERLDATSQIEVKEAASGDVLQTGKALVAPGNSNMVVTRAGEIVLNQDSSLCGIRPSVDVTMESVARVYGRDSIAVVLTGMGSDGTRGAARIKASGGGVLVEDESTCTVFGMPKSVLESGNADEVLPLPRIADGIMRLVARSQALVG